MCFALSTLDGNESQLNTSRNPEHGISNTSIPLDKINHKRDYPSVKYGVYVTRRKLAHFVQKDDFGRQEDCTRCEQNW